ncbi:alpha/beta fold hydrolase [Ottowia thiooxydans]|uniref:alpha/beta fold hydrolase n=1 Tax=Ottowia thiooxydans TaxID=219182 RepID=UPI00040F0AE6|nr:alpha/beta hydrolase [Ottowia thiooxydans]
MKLSINGITIEAEDSGGSGPPILLIMGLGGQLIHWPASFVQGLLDAGYRVLRFDNRDAGLSTHFPGKSAPNIPWIATQSWLGLKPRLPYSLADMATDARGVLDAFNVSRAHVIGLSMGAMIAQRVALAAPGRVASLTCIMGSSGARGLMKPTAAVLRAGAGKPGGQADAAALARYYVRFLQAISSPTLPPSEEAFLEVFERTAKRHSPDAAATARQLAAILADGRRAKLLAGISNPTLVIHGAEDPLVPPACGADTARRIPGARLEMIADMAHDLAPAVHPEVLRRVFAVLLPFLAEHPLDLPAAPEA